MTRKKSLDSALRENKGVKQPNSTSDSAIKKIKESRKNTPSVEKLFTEIKKGNIAYLSRAITLLESNNKEHEKKATELLEKCLPYANNSIRIGITGVPGVGKSTFIEAFGNFCTNNGKKIAVLAIDPSSLLNKGSILGDKTRMEELVKNENAFIRPSPSGESLGGVARKTRETIILCEAAGFDTIFIETVGVGQSETAVHSMVDFFLLLKLAGAGDELQGIKRGIIEMADLIVINKADNENIKQAKLAKTEFEKALHLYPAKDNGWQPKVILCSALYHEGIEDVYSIINSYFNLANENGSFQVKRNEQNNFWLLETIDRQLKNDFYSKKEIKEALKQFKSDVKNHKTTPFKAAKELLKLTNK